MRARILLLSLIAPACGLITGPDGVPVSFQILSVVPFTTWEEFYKPPVVVVEGVAAAVTIRGDFTLPCSNYRVTAEAERRRDTLAVRLEFGRERLCNNEVIKYDYRADLSDVRPGTYFVQVFHELFVQSQGGTGVREVKRGTVEVRDP